MNRLSSLSIFFPCYNDAGTIGQLVTIADQVAQELTDDYEIIVIEDGSTDHSAQVLQELISGFPKLIVVAHDRNKGYGAALKTGFANSTKDFIFYTDGDAQYDVFELRDMVHMMNEKVDVINAYKSRREDPWYRTLMGKIYFRVMRLLFNFHVRDVDCDFRLIRRRALEGIRLLHDSGTICVELVKKLEMAGAIFVDYPVHHYPRTYGKSQFFNFYKLFETFMSGIIFWIDLRLNPKKHRPAIIHKRVAPKINPTLKNDRSVGKLW